MMKSVTINKLLKEITLKAKEDLPIEDEIAETSTELEREWENQIGLLLLALLFFLESDSKKLTVKDFSYITETIEKMMGEEFAYRIPEILSDFNTTLYQLGKKNIAGKSVNFSVNDFKIMDKLNQNAFLWMEKHYSDNLKEGLEKILEEYKDLGRKKLSNVLKIQVPQALKQYNVYFNIFADQIGTQADILGRLSGLEETWVKKVRFQAVMDSRTSDICRAMNGKILILDDLKKQANDFIKAIDTGDKEKIKKAWAWFPEKDADKLKNKSSKQLARMGVGLPPLHARCRSIVVPV